MIKGTGAGALRVRVGERIRQRREHLDIGAREAAKRIGVNHQTLANYERGVRDIPLHTALRICVAYRMKLHELARPHEVRDA